MTQGKGYLLGPGGGNRYDRENMAHLWRALGEGGVHQYG